MAYWCDGCGVATTEEHSDERGAHRIGARYGDYGRMLAIVLRANEYVRERRIGATVSRERQLFDRLVEAVEMMPPEGWVSDA